MSTTPQKHALKRYRRRLHQRGMARFEVLGLDADRELIRSLAKRLAGEDSDSRGFERLSVVPFLASSRKWAAFSMHYGGRLWSAPISISAAR